MDSWNVVGLLEFFWHGVDFFCVALVQAFD